jgi:hypothetical protein
MDMASWTKRAGGKMLAALALQGCGLHTDSTMQGSDSEGASAAAGAESEAPADGSQSTPGSSEPSDSSWSRNVPLRGAYAYALEGSAFLPCGASEYWWTEFEGLALERFQDTVFDLGCEELGCVFSAAGDGDVSPRGRYGVQGDYSRSVTFTRLSVLARVRLAANPMVVNETSCDGSTAPPVR